MIHIPVLQTLDFYRTQTDWRTLAVMGGVSLVVILLLTILSRFSSRRNRRGKHRRYSRRAFRRSAASLGLSTTQVHLLENCIKAFNIKQPFHLLAPSSLLTSTIGKALHQFVHAKDSASVIEARKLELYRILQRIEVSASRKDSNLSTEMIRTGQNVVLTLTSGKEVKTVVTSNTEECFFVASPHGGSRSNDKDLGKARRVILTLYDDKDKKISFQTKVLGYAKVEETIDIMLKHTTGATSSDPRKHRRRPIRSRCVFYAMDVIGQRSRRRGTHRTVVASSQKISGSLVNISPGGCSAESSTQLSVGNLFKLAFDLPGVGHVEVYGKVINSRKNARRRSVFSILFTRASASNLNKINEYIYDLG